VVGFVAAVLFALVARGSVTRGACYELDQRVDARLAASAAHLPTALMSAVTHLGDVQTIVAGSLLVVIALLVVREHWHVLSLLLSVGIGGGLLSLMKVLFARSRPEYASGLASTDSFPSGHSFLAVTFYGFLLFLGWRHLCRNNLRIPLAVVLALVALLVPLSRVVLRVHWLSDVVAGAAFGVAWLLASLMVVRRLRESWLLERGARRVGRSSGDGRNVGS
jgi:undecaprenyl-diphosphatase